MSKRSINLTLNLDDITPVEIPFKWKEVNYVLREASGDAAVRYRNMILKSARLGQGGTPTSVDGMVDCEPFLISRCLFEVCDKGMTVPVPEKTIRSWPNRVQKRLFEKVLEISDLDVDDTEESLQADRDRIDQRLQEIRSKNGKPTEEDELKNSSDAMTDGSA